MDFTVNCGCGCAFGALMVVVGADLEAWRREAQTGATSGITCPDCGCVYNLSDGVTQINTADVSKPRIDSVSVATGPAAGGTAVVITGHRLDTAGLAVKFDGVAATGLRDQSNTSCTIDTPAHAAGAVDVTIENGNGQRAVGGTLPDGFVYT